MKLVDKTDINVLIDNEALRKKIDEIADKLNKEYLNDEVYLICVLKGSIVFTADLMRCLTMPLKLECIRLSSYGSSTVSSGKVRAVDISLPDLNNKNVIIIEDIIDTGHTAQFLLNFIHSNFKTKSLKFIALLDKKCRREVDIDPDIYGFLIDDKFVVGYGLDFDDYYRNLNYIGYINQ